MAGFPLLTLLFSCLFDMAAKLLALVIKYLNKSISSSTKDAKKVKSTSKKQDVTVGSVVSQSAKNHKGILRHFGMGLL